MKLPILVSMLIFVFSLTACKPPLPPLRGSISIQEHDADANHDPIYAAQSETVQSFFSFFMHADYEQMKTLCTKECISQYFHEGDVFGMESAALMRIDKTMSNSSVPGSSLFVDVEMVTAETSALYPDTETSFYVLLEEQQDGRWLIDGFTTG